MKLACFNFTIEALRDLINKISHYLRTLLGFIRHTLTALLCVNSAMQVSVEQIQDGCLCVAAQSWLTYLSLWQTVGEIELFYC